MNYLQDHLHTLQSDPESYTPPADVLALLDPWTDDQQDDCAQ